MRVTEKVTRPLPHDNQEIINATRISLFSRNRCTQEDAGGGGALGRRGPAVSPAANVWNHAAGDRASSGVAATAPGERSRNGIHGPVLATGLQQHIGEISRALSQAMLDHAPILRRLSQVPGGGDLRRPGLVSRDRSGRHGIRQRSAVCQLGGRVSRSIGICRSKLLQPVAQRESLYAAPAVPSRVGGLADQGDFLRQLVLPAESQSGGQSGRLGRRSSPGTRDLGIVAPRCRLRRARTSPPESTTLAPQVPPTADGAISRQHRRRGITSATQFTFLAGKIFEGACAT